MEDFQITLSIAPQKAKGPTNSNKQQVYELGAVCRLGETKRVAACPSQKSEGQQMLPRLETLEFTIHDTECARGGFHLLLISLAFYFTPLVCCYL
jgi:hypothetical protein